MRATRRCARPGSSSARRYWWRWRLTRTAGVRYWRSNSRVSGRREGAEVLAALRGYFSVRDQTPVQSADGAAVAAGKRASRRWRRRRAATRWRRVDLTIEIGPPMIQLGSRTSVADHVVENPQIVIVPRDAAGVVDQHIDGAAGCLLDPRDPCRCRDAVAQVHHLCFDS